MAKRLIICDIKDNQKLTRFVEDLKCRFRGLERVNDTTFLIESGKAWNDFLDELGQGVFSAQSMPCEDRIITVFPRAVTEAETAAKQVFCQRCGVFAGSAEASFTPELEVHSNTI